MEVLMIVKLPPMYTCVDVSFDFGCWCIRTHREFPLSGISPIGLCLFFVHWAEIKRRSYDGILTFRVQGRQGYGNASNHPLTTSLCDRHVEMRHSFLQTSPKTRNLFPLTSQVDVWRGTCIRRLRSSGQELGSGAANGSSVGSSTQRYSILFAIACAYSRP